MLDGSAPESVKLQVRGTMNKLNNIGKPLVIKFTSLDGREVDLAQMGGKVVLVEFWATWCAPCVANLPSTKALYDAYHTNGFEIVGISLDNDEAKLKRLLRQKGVPWPQYFDPKGTTNHFARQFGISGVPAFFLVDKKGVLRDARPDVAGLTNEVARLLAEPW